MTTQIVGQPSSWNDIKGKGGGGGKDEYMNLQVGSNFARVLGVAMQYVVHYYKSPHWAGNPNSKGAKVKCTGDSTTCHLCSDGNKSENRWYVPIIDRRSGLLKALDAGWLIIQDIKKLNASKAGDVTKYDVDIQMDPQGGATGYYKVMMDPTTWGKPMTPDDLERKKTFENNPDFLAKKCAFLSPEDQKKKIDFLNTPPKKDGQKSQASASLIKTDQTSASLTKTDEYDFPEHTTD